MKRKNSSTELFNVIQRQISDFFIGNFYSRIRYTYETFDGGKDLIIRWNDRHSNKNSSTSNFPLSLSLERAYRRVQSTPDISPSWKTPFCPKSRVDNLPSRD